jgi:hypothetical protein
MIYAIEISGREKDPVGTRKPPVGRGKDPVGRPSEIGPVGREKDGRVKSPVGRDKDGRVKSPVGMERLGKVGTRKEAPTDGFRRLNPPKRRPLSPVGKGRLSVMACGGANVTGDAFL